MNLQKLQDNFIDYLYDNKKDNVLNLVKGGKIKKEKIFQIYRNNLFQTLKNSLKITFPFIYRYLGEENFCKISYEFISKNPSKSSNLDNYGQNFCHDKSEFLRDLSKFEWFQHLSYLKEDSESISQEDLYKIPPEKLFNLKFQLNPSVFLMQSYYNFFLKKNSDQKKKRIINYLIYRQNNHVKFEKISKLDYIFLIEIKNSLSLFEIYNKYEVDVGNFLAKYVNNEIINN